VEHQIEALRAVGVNTIFVVVGYKRELLTEFLEGRFDDIRFVVNEDFASTNTIYSLYLALPFLNEDFFYLNGDVLFRKELLEQLMAEDKTSLAVEHKACGDEEVKVRVNGRRITAISKGVPPGDAKGEFVGVALFRRNMHSVFFERIRYEVENRCIVRDYFEQALHKIAERIELLSVDVTGEPVIEIDYPEDLRRAKILISRMEGETLDLLNGNQGHATEST
jgi:choline kinase